MSSLDDAHKALATNDVPGAIDKTTHRMTIGSDSQGVIDGARVARANEHGFTDADATGSNAGGPNTNIDAYYVVLPGRIRFPDYTDTDSPSRVEIEIEDIIGPILPENNWIGSGANQTYVFFQLLAGALEIVETTGDSENYQPLIDAGLPFFYSATLIHPQQSPPFLQTVLRNISNQALQLRNPVRQIGELTAGLGTGWRVDGMLLTAIPGTLTVTRAAGNDYAFSTFPQNDLVSTNPSEEAVAPNIARTAVDPETGVPVPVMSPAGPELKINLYDEDGAIVNIGPGKWWTIKTMYQHQGDGTQATLDRFGRQLFKTKAAAISALPVAMAIPPIRFKGSGWYVVGFIVVEADATDLDDPEQAQIFHTYGEFIGTQSDIELNYAPATDRIVTTTDRAYNGDRVAADTTGGSFTLTADETCDGFAAYDVRASWNMGSLTVDLDGALYVLNQKEREYVFTRVSGTTWYAYYRAIKVVL